MKQDQERLLHRLFWALALAAIAFLGLTTVYSSDDYAYSQYFDNGLLGYLPLAKAHYETVNGRALVHLFAHILLEFPSWVFCLVCLGCTLAVPVLCVRHWPLEKPDRARGLSIYLLLYTAMPAAILTQGVMWVSAFCNYVIPCVMVCGLMSLLLDREWSGRKRLCAAVLALCCGATTEQMGAVTLAVLALLLLRELRERSGRPWEHGLLLLLAAAGWATIFLSPSTQGRLLRETQVTAPEGMLDSLLAGFRQQTVLLSGTPAVALAVTLVFVSLLWTMGRKRPWTAVPALVGAVGAWCGCLGTGTLRETGWAAVYVLLVLMGLLLMWDRRELPGLLLIAAVASACIMLPTQSNRSRCFLPMYLFLIAAAAGLTAEALRKGRRRWLLPALSGLLIFSMVSCLPVLQGYWHNYRIDRINAAWAEQAREGGPLYYCMDYDKRYTDSKPYDSGGAYEDHYLGSIGLDPDTQVLYYGEGLSAVYYQNERLRFPAYPRGGLSYLPLRSIVEGAGGTVTLEGGKLLVTLGDCSCTLDYIFTGDTTVRWEGGSGLYACDNGVAGFYLTEAFFTERLGLTLEWSADRTELHIR